MNPTEAVYRVIVVPGLELLEELGGPLRSQPAEVLLVAIAGQESDWKARRQHGGGPAHGLWQFEQRGGVLGVLTHPATGDLARALCGVRDVAPDAALVHERLAEDDLLACGFARLLLWSDPRPLPNSRRDAWAYYLRNWRPGKPHARRWSANYAAALEAVHGGAHA